MPKASSAQQVRVLTDIPNIGKSLAAELQGLGIVSPEAVRRMDPIAVYEQLREPMGKRHDPCVLDAFMAAHDFMNGGARQPWWHFTSRRKVLLGKKL